MTTFYNFVTFADGRGREISCKLKIRDFSDGAFAVEIRYNDSFYRLKEAEI